MSRLIGNGLDLDNRPIDNVADPSTAQQAATKNYVDMVARGLDWKASVRATTTGNGALATAYENGDTIDGVVLATGDRILLKDQTTGSENGIYTVNASGAPTRAIDADSSAEVTSGMAVSVTEGTVNGDKTFILTTNDPITLGTTALVFAQLGGGGGTTYTAGNGLTDSPANTFNVGAGTGILVTADAVAIDPAVVTRKFSANIGNGALTTITVTHNLGTLDVQVTVFLNATGAEVTTDVVHTGINTVDVSFATAPASNAYRVVVIG